MEIAVQLFLYLCFLFLGIIVGRTSMAFQVALSRDRMASNDKGNKQNEINNPNRNNIVDQQDN